MGRDMVMMYIPNRAEMHISEMLWFHFHSWMSKYVVVESSVGTRACKIRVLTRGGANLRLSPTHGAAGTAALPHQSGP